MTNKKFNAFKVNKIAKTAQYRKVVTSKVKLTESIKEAAKNGEYQIIINHLTYEGYWYEIKTWLEGLGFLVDRVPASCSTYYVKWG